MAKIVTAYDFTLEVGDSVYIGTLTELDSDEVKKFNKIVKKQGLDTEGEYKLGLTKRIVSDQKDEIMEVGRLWGYELTLKTILLDIRDNLKKKEKG